MWLLSGHVQNQIGALTHPKFLQTRAAAFARFPAETMRTRSEILARLADPGIIAVVRAKRTEQAVPLAEALVAGGVIAVEITLTTPDAFRAIREVRLTLGERALVGVGTVLTTQECHDALEAGAEFVVTPICRTELVALAHAADKPVMLGAYTPTEAQRAHEAGADFIKIFPADGLGPNFIKALRAPLPHLRIVPTGGVVLGNVGQWFEAGCRAVGVGSSLITKEILANDDWPALTRLASQYVAAAKAARRTT
jgi:2-dehydro-3-deoxyphosphogluconate aldolase / (4S)-4-hydroxy-2-oxoglutarate aldolase